VHGYLLGASKKTVVIPAQAGIHFSCHQQGTIEMDYARLLPRTLRAMRFGILFPQSRFREDDD